MAVLPDGARPIVLSQIGPLESCRVTPTHKHTHTPIQIKSKCIKINIQKGVGVTITMPATTTNKQILITTIRLPTIEILKAAPATSLT